MANKADFAVVKKMPAAEVLILSRVWLYNGEATLAEARSFGGFNFQEGRRRKTMRVLFAVLALGFAVVMGQPEQASATALKHCGCYAKFDKCMRNLKPGDSVDGMTACDNDFNSCISACDSRQGCEEDCKTAIKDGKKTCNESFKDTLCAIGDASCKKDAAKARKACVDGLGKKKDCTSTCKTKSST